MNGRVITREMRRQLERDNAKQPAVLEPVPGSLWPASTWNMAHPPFEVWRSRFYLVQGFRENGGVIRLSVCKTQVEDDGRLVDGLAWDELQEIKRQVGYGDAYAIEVYPRDKDIVNVANMRHLWVMPAQLPIGWRREG
jgi:hypothetical protein